MEKGVIDTDMSIGGIENYYGGVMVRYYEGKCYWGIYNYDSEWENALNMWEEIPESLYDELVKYESLRRIKKIKSLNEKN